MRKVLVLSVGAVVDVNSSRVLKQGKTLQDAGYSVFVFSKAKNNCQSSEIIDGIQIERIHLSSKKFPSNIITHFFHFLEFYLKIRKKCMDFDIIDCHSVTSLLVGYSIARKTKAKIIFNPHELETETTGLSGFLKKLHKLLEKKLIYKCAHVITVSESIQDWYKKEYSIDNVSCIYNAPRYTDDFDANNDYFRKHFDIPSDSMIFLYQGILDVARGLDLLIDCFKTLSNKYVVIFMGDGSLSEYIQTEADSVDNIFYHEVVPMSKLKDTTSSADYGMSLIAPISLNEEYCMPNKLFEYIMYGVPVIGFNTKDQAEFIKKHDIGYVLEKYDATSLKELILSIDSKKYTVLKEHVKKIRKDISWDAMEKQLLDIYADC